MALPLKTPDMHLVGGSPPGNSRFFYGTWNINDIVEDEKTGVGTPEALNVRISDIRVYLVLKKNNYIKTNPFA